jgi:hypothetical protein
MATLELSKEETAFVLETLESYLSDLRLEIGDTKKKEFRDDLKKKEGMLKGIIERIRALG